MGGDLVRVARDSALAALLTLVLTVPIVGLRTIASPAGLHIEVQVRPVVEIIVLVAGLRFLIGLWALRSRESRPSAGGNLPLGRWAAGLGLVGAIVLPFVGSGYVTDLGINILIYVMLGWGLNIVVGLAGLLDLGYVAFYGVGAYTFGLLASDFGWTFWEALPLCGLFAAGFGVTLGFPVLRLRGDYLAIVTLGFGEIIREVLLNWGTVTNGPNGINGIPRPSFFGLPFSRYAPDGGKTFADFFHLAYSPSQRQIYLYFVILVMALLTNFFTLRIRRLPIGRAWEALREDEIACRALGINATNVKLSAFGIGAMFGGFAGAFFAARIGFISPESFNFGESALILAIVVLGGLGSQLGIVLAAIGLVSFSEIARSLADLGGGLGGLIPANFGDYRMLLFGAAMVAIMVTRPRGLLSRRNPSVLLGAGSS
jgi:branched-chain amino acid transport system permease protein